MGRDHSCEGCGNGGFANDLPCECEPQKATMPNMAEIKMRRCVGCGAEALPEVPVAGFPHYAHCPIAKVEAAFGARVTHIELTDNYAWSATGDGLGGVALSLPRRQFHGYDDPRTYEHLPAGFKDFDDPVAHKEALRHWGAFENPDVIGEMLIEGEPYQPSKNVREWRNEAMRLRAILTGLGVDPDSESLPDGSETE